MSVLEVRSVTEVHRWGDLGPVRRDYDMRVDGKRVTLTPPSVDVPAFEACTACPSCDHLAVHGWREPRIIPPKQVEIPVGVDGPAGPGAETHRSLTNRMMWSRPAYFVADESRFAVIRQCAQCGHEWGQA